MKDNRVKVDRGEFWDNFYLEVRYIIDREKIIDIQGIQKIDRYRMIKGYMVDSLKIINGRQIIIVKGQTKDRLLKDY